MEFLFFTILLFIFFFVIITFVSLVSLHLQYLVILFKKRSETENFRYIGFVKSKLSKRNVLTVLVWAPLFLTGVILVLVSIRAPYSTYKLRSELESASKFVIRTGGVCHRMPERERVLFETSDSNQIKEFLGKIFFRPSMIGMSCLCCGSMTFEFYDSNGELFRACSFHHNSHIRTQDSVGDLYLSPRSKRSLDNWLIQKGVRQKEKEFKKELEKLLEERTKELEVNQE